MVTRNFVIYVLFKLITIFFFVLVARHDVILCATLVDFLLVLIFVIRFHVIFCEFLANVNFTFYHGC